jgi:hypothetical protein
MLANPSSIGFYSEMKISVVAFCVLFLLSEDSLAQSAFDRFMSGVPDGTPANGANQFEKSPMDSGTRLRLSQSRLKAESEILKQRERIELLERQARARQQAPAAIAALSQLDPKNDPNYEAKFAAVFAKYPDAMLDERVVNFIRIQRGGANGVVIKNEAPAAGLGIRLGGGHWLKKNIDDGSLLLLDDGSIWEVQRLDRLDSRFWLEFTSITIAESTDGLLGYDFLLINTDDGEKVHAKFISKN